MTISQFHFELLISSMYPAWPFGAIHTRCQILLDPSSSDIIWYHDESTAIWWLWCHVWKAPCNDFDYWICQRCWVRALTSLYHYDCIVKFMNFIIIVLCKKIWSGYNMTSQFSLKTSAGMEMAQLAIRLLQLPPFLMLLQQHFIALIVFVGQYSLNNLHARICSLLRSQMHKFAMSKKSFSWIQIAKYQNLETKYFIPWGYIIYAT